MVSLLASSEHKQGGGAWKKNNAYSLVGSSSSSGSSGTMAKRRLALILSLVFVLCMSLSSVLSSRRRNNPNSNSSTSQPKAPSTVTQRQPLPAESKMAEKKVHNTGEEEGNSVFDDDNDDTNDDDDDNDDDNDDDSTEKDFAEDEEPGEEENGDDNDDENNGTEDMWTALTSVPTVSPTPLPVIPDELLPKLPDKPAFDFEVPNTTDGCFLNMTGEAQFTNYPQRHPLNNLVSIVQAGEIRPFDRRNASDRPKAICRFRKVGNYMHFPHMMQSFTRCLSFFLTFPEHEPYIVRETHRRYWTGFNIGIANIFKWLFAGKMTSTTGHLADENNIVVAPLVDPGYEEGPYQGIAFQQVAHAQVLRQRVSNFYNISQEGCQPGKDHPVIGILNRNETAARTLLNAQQLQTFLAKMTDRPVEIVYFENKTFLEQVEFMMQTDILVSPHGAQLTSINFMSSCGGVFEIFPPGYWFPNFFGPLAATSGLSHGYVYTGYDWVQEWQKKGRVNKKLRNFARELDVCIPLNTSLTVIGQMVDNWKTCCHNQLKAQGRNGNDSMGAIK